MVKDLSLVPLFETFIKETANGKRRMFNSLKVKPQTVDNYRELLKLLIDYETFSGKKLIIKTNIRNNIRLIRRERKYWSDFYKKFSFYLFRQKNCFDNYAGSVFKMLKCFFRYLRNEKFLGLLEFYESFYVRHEEIRIISLLPERFCFLIMDKEFEAKLKPKLNQWKDVFAFGCTGALRFSDLMNLKVRDIEFHGNEYFLYYKSLKTDTPVNMKLPRFAVDIFLKYSNRKRASAKLFPQTSLLNFNKNIRTIARLAGWMEPIGKFRNRDGHAVEIKKGKQGLYRFCDLVTSHVMRRTGITILLMMGMPEILVRKISGHTAHSASFFRYVNYAQSYLTDEIDKVYIKLQDLYSHKLN